MSINSIDTLLDNALDDFFKENKLSSFFKMSNFVEKQKILLDGINNYLKTIDLKDIKKNIKDEHNLKFIVNTIYKYIFYYSFILIGYHYTERIDVFKNNIIEISKLYDKQLYNVDDFFTSETNSNIFKLTEIVRTIHDINEVQKKKTEVKNEEMLKFIQEIGEETYDTFMNKLKQEKNEKKKDHVIIKFCLLQKLYLIDDKNTILKLLETENMEFGESIYIDIVVPLEKSIDIVEIESMLSQEDIEHGVAKNIFDIINKSELVYQQREIKMVENKISDLINSGFLVPVSEEFLLFHNDGEKYDVKKEKNFREENKIKYILDKISDVENFYNETNSDAKSMPHIYNPLSNRLAVTCNENEDLNIINKMSKYQTKAGEINLNDELINYRKYPYINFKHFNKYGFPLIFDKTKTVVRSVSFTDSRNAKDQIQIRIGSTEQQVNIVGFLLNPSKIPLECMKVKQIKRMTNGISEFLINIQKYIETGKTDVSLWLFNLETDGSNIQTYERLEKANQSEKNKFICGNLYDEIINFVYQKIINVLKKHKELSLFKSFQIIKTIMNNTLQISENDSRYIEILKVVFHKVYEKYDPIYDKKEDIIYGLFGDTLKLPYIPIKKEETVLQLKISYDKKPATLSTNEKVVNVVCQHYITWVNLMDQKKNSSVKFMDLMYDFMQTFVYENEDMDYICKSCGSLLDIKKYVADGTYDEASQKFIPYSTPMHISLEDLPEYRRYNVVIRNIDSLINKIAENVNIPYLAGSATTQKINRTAIVKNAIDLILMNNTILKKNFKERNINASKVYGINRDLSNLFAFELDNSIFLYTPGKEKDYYKYVKNNNILTYLMFLILIELGESHIAFISSDKVCNYNSFVKFGKLVFGGLKLRINDNGDVRNVEEYPVMCYIIYVMTCILSKYPMWYHESDETVTKKKVNPEKQKIMVQTLIDMINCILENAEENKDKHIFEIVNSKFHKKLETLFSSSEIMKKLKYDNLPLPDYEKIIEKEKVKPMELNNPYETMKLGDSDYYKYHSAKYFTKEKQLIATVVDVSNLLYCNTGAFHVWNPEGKTMKCERCSVVLSEQKYDKDLTKKIVENINLRYLEKLRDIYCLTGDLHSFEKKTGMNSESVQICLRCGYKLDDYVPYKDLEKLEEKISKPQLLFREEDATKKKKYDEFIKNIIGKLKEKYVESKTHRDDYYKFIENFISLLQNIVGDSIKIDDKTIKLKEDTYIIDHNHLGYPVEPPMTVNEHSKNISFKKNHSFFKKDVISYYAGSTAKIEVFYDMYSHILLGYKEFNKDFIVSKKTENQIRIEYSLENQIKYLGNSNIFIDVSTNKNILEVIGNSSRERIENIGNIIYKFLVYLNMIKNNKKQEKSTEPEEENNYLFEVEKYNRKLMGVITKLEDFKIFKRWQLIIKHIHYQEKIKQINIDTKNNLLSLDDVHDSDYSGNLILYYFISNLTKLIEMNKNKFIKENLTLFIIEFINIMFKTYNDDYYKSNKEIQRFKSILESSEYFREIEGFGMDEYTVGLYGEYQDPDDVKSKEEQEADEEAKAENEGYDMDGHVDMEDYYDETHVDRDLSRIQPSKWEQTITDKFEY